MKRIHYILFCLILTAATSVISGCSDCDTCGYAEVVPGEIYLTSESANADIGCIYSLNDNGQNVRIVSENSFLMSAPSSAGLLLLRTLEDGSWHIRIYDIKNEGFRPYAVPDSLFDGEISEGSISPDGQYCALVSEGSRDVAVVEIKAGEVQLLSYKSSFGASPVFSPSGNKIFYVSVGNEIVEYDVASGEIDRHSLSGDAGDYAVEFLTCDDKYLYIPYKFKDNYRIFRFNFGDGAGELLQTENAGRFPAVSDGSNGLIYSDADGDLHKAVFPQNSTVPTSDNTFYIVNPDEVCYISGYNKVKNSVAFIVLKKEASDASIATSGSFFVLNFNTGKSVYLFSNVMDGYWY